MITKVQLFEMTRPEVEAAMGSGYDTAVATFGSTEQHGQHLPLGTDSIWGEEIGLRVTKALGNALQVPGVRLGRSEHHMDFPGSLTVSETTFNAIVHDICECMAHHGFKHMVLLPTHGGNFAPLGKAADLIRPKFPHLNIIAYSDLVSFVNVLFGVAERYGFSAEHTGAHAGENETSMILALRPDLVNLDVAVAGWIGDVLSMADKIAGSSFKDLSETGVLGDPAGASAEIGEAYLVAMTDLFVEFIEAKRHPTT